MLQNKEKSHLPKGFLFRLTFINIVVITCFVVLSGWAIYNTACKLADGFVTNNDQGQAQFEATLFQYLWIFIVLTIIIGSLVHYYLTKKLIHPLRELIQSTKLMKQGEYPPPLNKKSEDELGQLTDHFNALVRQLKDNQHYKQKLVSDLSHEFRTPLANLNGYLHALRSGVIEGDQQLYRSLHEESMRLNKLVEQMELLKEWDYVSTQTFSEKEPANLKTLIEQSVDMFHWTLTQRNIQVDIEVQPVVLQVDKDGITQVVSNLVDNAIQYYKGRAPIKIKGERQASGYTFSITGPGQPIPEEALEKVFERFYRADQSRSRDSGGSGLGLAISKEIIEHHHGEIGVISEGGSHTFWFSLPLANVKE